MMTTSVSTSNHVPVAATEASAFGSMMRVPGSDDTYLLRQSSVLVMDSEKDFFEKSFPDVFPYGCGGPGSQRHVYVARDSALAHLLRIGRACVVGNLRLMATIFDVTNRQAVGSERE